MKEKRTVQEKTIVIDIKLTKGLVVVLSCALAGVVLLAYLMLTGKSAVASETETAQAASTGMRQFYLTSSWVKGNEVLTACADGYHFASLWEIVDPSNLKYNTALGDTEDDSGQGPPASSFGWVRTGSLTSQGSTAGQANCDVWSTTGGNGSRAYFLPNWSSGQDVGVWTRDKFMWD